VWYVQKDCSRIDHCVRSCIRRLLASLSSLALALGATDEEVALEMPGDELIKQLTFNVMRAITIQARPEEIWPWIIQIGFHRAGFYSYDLLDNFGKPSTDHIFPELQHIEVGTWIPMSGKVAEETAFRVRAFEPYRWILWEKAASTWAWKLLPIDEEHTRLLIRLKCHYRWARLTIVTDLFLMEIGDFPMMRKLMLGLKRRAEKAHADVGGRGDEFTPHIVGL
jgi:hypothetical protein